MSIELISNNIRKLDKFNVNYHVECTRAIRTGGIVSHQYNCLVWVKEDYDFKDFMIGEYKRFDHIEKLLFYINEVNQHLKVHLPHLVK